MTQPPAPAVAGGTHLADPAATAAFGAAFAGALRAGDVVCLNGPLGAGKTTFVRAAAQALGVTDAPASPTYAIVQRYRGPLPVVHVDLYRTENADELVHLDADDWLPAPDAVVFIEWAERLAAWGVPLPPAWRVSLDVSPVGGRVVAVTPPDRRSAA